MKNELDIDDAPCLVNRNLIVVQSRLFSPSYAGPCRWIIFDPKTRRSFAAFGLDIFPESLRILAAAVESNQTAFKQQLTHNDAQSLVKNGLLVKSYANCLEAKTFVEYYQQAVYDYPFQDYSDPSWRENDLKLMQEYAKLWAPPMVEEVREGAAYDLPTLSFADIEDINFGTELSLNELAYILKFTFGAIGSVNSAFQVCIRRTSPSGGARHPTECFVILPKGLDYIPPGLYVYDTKRHKLVLSKPDENTSKTFPQNARVGFSIRSRVERAMWRYRDIRSFRPVLIDAGHILENILSFLQVLEGNVLILQPKRAECEKYEWYLESELFVVWYGENKILANKDEIAPSIVEYDSETKFYTNPLAYYDFGQEGLRLNVLWPEKKSFFVSDNKFKILNHCIPSNRGDRLTAEPGLLDQLPEVSGDDFKYLVDNYALINTEVALDIYKGSRLWARYGWYLSLLAHVDNAVDYRPWQVAMDTLTDDRERNKITLLEKMKLMLKRKTTRSFKLKAIAQETLITLLNSTVQNAKSLRVFCCAYTNEREGEGTLFEFVDSRLVKIAALTRDIVMKNTIGQFPASSGAFTIWLCTQETTMGYEMNIIHLGMIAQKICLEAERLNIGVFLTPAVNDKAVDNMLGIKNTVYYLLSLGEKADA